MTQSSKKSGTLQAVLAAAVIPIALVIGYLIWKFIMGDPAGFEDGDPEKNPLPNNILATMYKGGPLVPVLICLAITAITFSIERIISIGKSKGSGRIETFIQKIRSLMAQGNIEGAKSECQRQRGSIANVVVSGLGMYEMMEKDQNLDKERKLLAIQKELEEATTLELPMLSKNLVIISTIASIATLLGLFGTVLGMIRAFAALATAGAPDAVALSTGISEALVNTALGIGTSAIAIIMYNYFTNKIDGITYGIDEAGYSIVQSFASRYKDNR
ncbi:MAG: MotA/TolQ/ExbB proton channel family protein [Bacteroidia bacterium]|nr:MotA/TolQ/ExbB proton channel family protein [Bacteroidia bacterium]